MYFSSTRKRHTCIYVHSENETTYKIKNKQLQETIKDNNPWSVQVKLLCNPARNVR